MRIYPWTVLYGKINTFDWFKDHRSEWAMASIAAMRLYEITGGQMFLNGTVFCIMLLSRVVGKACSYPWSTNSEVGHWIFIFHPNQLQEAKNCEAERSTVFGKKPWKIVTIKDTTWYNHCSAQIACPKNCFFRVGEKNNMQWAPKLNINRCWTQPLLKWTVFKTLSSSLQNWLDKNGIPHSWIVMPNGQCYPQSQPTISYTVIPANQSPKFDT